MFTGKYMLGSKIRCVCACVYTSNRTKVRKVHSLKILRNQLNR